MGLFCKYIFSLSDCLKFSLSIFRLVKQFCKDGRDSKRAHDTLQSVGLANGGKVTLHLS